MRSHPAYRAPEEVTATVRELVTHGSFTVLQ
jgi:hypothetical protein